MMAYNIINFHTSQARKALKKAIKSVTIYNTMKKALFILIVLVLLVAINSLLHSIYDLWHKQDLLTVAQKQLDSEKLKNQKLKAQFVFSQTNQFLEEQAHNKLFLVKPGEQKVLISPDLNKIKSEQKQVKVPNWQQWLNLFW
jgi:cell division protein FtsB